MAQRAADVVAEADRAHPDGEGGTRPRPGPPLALPADERSHARPHRVEHPGVDDDPRHVYHNIAIAIDAAMDVMPLAVSGDFNEAMKRLHTPQP